jgi:hypothetical protein
VESEGTVYGLLGPFAAVDVIKEVRVAPMALANGQVYFGFAYGASGQANAASYAAGVSLIQRSNVDDVDGQPFWRVGVAAYRTWELVVPAGFAGTSGARWIVCRVQNVTASSMWGLVSAHVVRVVPEKAESS